MAFGEMRSIQPAPNRAVVCTLCVRTGSNGGRGGGVYPQWPGGGGGGGSNFVTGWSSCNFFIDSRSSDVTLWSCRTPTRYSFLPGCGSTSKCVALWPTSPPPPTPPWKWQKTHDFALNTGPKPSPWASGSLAAHSCSNSSRPAALSAADAVGPHHTGRPFEKNCQYTTAAATTAIAIPTRRR